MTLRSLSFECSRVADNNPMWRLRQYSQVRLSHREAMVSHHGIFVATQGLTSLCLRADKANLSPIGAVRMIAQARESHVGC